MSLTLLARRLRF